MLTGVYSITCIPTGKQYVGSAAISFAKRFAQHRHDLRSGKHRSAFMQRAWLKYGESAFSFDVVEETAPADAIVAEQIWIDRLRPVFNTAKIAGSSLGIKRHFSNAQKARIRALRRRINLSKPDRNMGHLLEVVRSPAFREMQSVRMRSAIAAGRYIEPNKRAGLTRSKRHCVRGEMLTVKEIAAKYGKTPKAVSRRIERGYRGDDIVAPRYARLA